MRKPAAFALIVLGLAVSVPASAEAANCPPRKGTLATKSLGRVWHKGHSLFACTTVYGHRPRARRMGPWTKATKVAFDGDDLAWTTRVTRNGTQVDRAWAGSADTGKRWMTGAQLVPASGSSPPAEAKVQRIFQLDRGAAWMTQNSQLVLALQDPGGSDPTAIGTPPAPLAPADNMLLVGQFSYPADVLSQTVKFTEKEQDGDECGALDTYTLTVTPGGQPPVGVNWDGYWTSTNC